MTTTSLTSDSLAIVLLCSRLALPRQEGEIARPLSIGEWTRLARDIAASELSRPGGLLGRTAAELRAVLDLDPPLAERVAALLDRSGQVAIELERLASRGIWVLTRIDEAYPARLKRHLGAQTAPVLFGAGPIDLLSTAGLAVVGSRHVDDDGTRFALEIGRRCAADGLTVISGAARGVDRLAMSAALERSATAVGVLADSLERLVRDPGVRKHLLGERLTLTTPYHPATGFSVGNAMGRNKLIYCLSEYALVVATSTDGGGTWAGAIENLRAGWVPLFVRSAHSAPPGNRALIERGGIPLELEPISNAGDLRTWLDERAAEWRAASGRRAVSDAPVNGSESERPEPRIKQPPLFGDSEPEAGSTRAGRRTRATVPYPNGLSNSRGARRPRT